MFRSGVELVGIASERRADEIPAAIHAEMPWMAAATDFLWKAMRRSVRAGEPGFRLPHMQLDDPSGIGKSVWSRELGRHLGVPRCNKDFFNSIGGKQPFAAAYADNRKADFLLSAARAPMPSSANR